MLAIRRIRALGRATKHPPDSHKPKQRGGHHWNKCPERQRVAQSVPGNAIERTGDCDPNEEDSLTSAACSPKGPALIRSLKS